MQLAYIEATIGARREAAEYANRACLLGVTRACRILASVQQAEQDRQEFIARKQQELETQEIQWQNNLDLLRMQAAAAQQAEESNRHMWCPLWALSGAAPNALCP